MKKLRLDLDELSVQTFDTGSDGALRGTVVGNGSTLVCTQGHLTLCESFCDATDGRVGCHYSHYEICTADGCASYACEPTSDEPLSLDEWCMPD